MSELFPDSDSEDEYPTYADGTRWLMANEITLKNAQTAGYLAICPEFIEKRTIDFIEFLKNVRSNNYLLVFNYHRRPNEYENKLIEEFYGKLM
jgi:hypothetical protein